MYAEERGNVYVTVIRGIDLLALEGGKHTVEEIFVIGNRHRVFLTFDFLYTNRAQTFNKVGLLLVVGVFGFRNGGFKFFGIERVERVVSGFEYAEFFLRRIGENSSRNVRVGEYLCVFVNKRRDGCVVLRYYAVALCVKLVESVFNIGGPEVIYSNVSIFGYFSVDACGRKRFDMRRVNSAECVIILVCGVYAVVYVSADLFFVNGYFVRRVVTAE